MYWHVKNIKKRNLDCFILEENAWKCNLIYIRKKTKLYFTAVSPKKEQPGFRLLHFWLAYTWYLTNPKENLKKKNLYWTVLGKQSFIYHTWYNNWLVEHSYGQLNLSFRLWIFVSSLYLKIYIISLFPLTEVAENRFCSIWVICCTTSEIMEEIDNKFSVDQSYFIIVRHKRC